MAEGGKLRGKAAAKDGELKQDKPRRKLSAEAKRKRAAARRKAAQEKREAERLAGLSPAELVAEDDAKREEQLSGPAATVERARLYREVMRDWARGMNYAALSSKHNLSERRISEVVESLRGSRLSAMGIGDPLFGVKFAQDLVVQKAAAVSQYVELADATDDKQPQVKLGYLKLRDAALDSFIGLVQELGWLPKNLGTLNLQMDAIQMAETILDVLEEEGISEDVQRRIVEAIELRVVKRGDRLALAPVGVQGFDAEATATEVRDGGDGSEAAGRHPAAA